jgi:protocatechuate 3,4-dioxygenase beta subunit
MYIAISMTLKINFKSIFVHLFFLLITFGFFLTRPAFADTFNLSGNVSDSVGNDISGATVDVVNPSNSTTVASTSTNSQGDYSMTFEEGTYNVQVTPPVGSNFSPVIALEQNVDSNTVLNFILAPQGQFTLSGHIYDEYGNGMPNQTVRTALNGTGYTATTNASGEYTFTNLIAGNYDYVEVNRGDPFNPPATNDGTLNAPKAYLIRFGGFSLSQSVIKDYSVSANKVTVHVQDTSGTAISGAGVSASKMNAYPFGVDSNGVTNSSGDIILWAFNGANISASPPSGSNLQPKTVTPNIPSDTTVTIVLEEPISLTGHIYDKYGNGLPNQSINISLSGGGGYNTTTNSSGEYTFPNLPVGNYSFLEVRRNNPFSPPATNDGTMNEPKAYIVRFGGFSLTQATVQDYTITAHQVTVHVQDTSGTAISGAGVSGSYMNTYPFFVDSNGLTNASGDVVLWMFGGSITATPPSGTNFQPKTITPSIPSDTTVTVVLEQPVTLTGHIYDEYGNPLPNQDINIGLSSGGGFNTTTNTSGQYTFPNLPVGSYSFLEVRRSNPFSPPATNDGTLNEPKAYIVRFGGFTLTQNTTTDYAIDGRKLTVHVQDPGGNPVSGASVTAAKMNSYPFAVDSNGVTNSSGNIILWVFSGTNLNISPPSGGPFNNVTINNLSVPSDQTQIISLQYNHATPVTTIDLQTQHTDGTYSNPTTATLSATADSGYTVANTYYKVDGGLQQTYTAPFTVSGLGDHSIEYWSVDNTGVQEAHKTENFTIYINQAPFVDPLSDVEITAGDMYTATGSFTDSDSTSWTATVDYDDGAGPENLPLNPDKTFSLSHQYNTAGEYAVTVVVRDDGQATGTTLATVTVVAPTPTPTPTSTPTPTPTPGPVTVTFDSSADTYVRSGQDNHNYGAGAFMNIQASGDNRSLVKFDQSAIQSSISGTVLSAKLRVTIVDNGNNWGATGRTVDIHRLISDWSEGNGIENDRGTGSGSTWNCAIDSIISNQAKNCSGSTEWEMGQPNNPNVHPWAASPSDSETITNNQSGVVEYDVTSDVTSFLDGTNSNYGWLIKKTNEGQNGQVSFGTKESSSIPQLVVTYQP